ncbi:hypothetical protein GGX14DRAFT_652538 [Mycena pura]|uniref:Uncharacterized protein n=1 Tax=Mycena pura TaxID=153505 RepID=A0AAD6V8V0_9AGAR|nr:hypothetical protein GGX14DRAFT_652538 [Mycena pura]
MFAAPLSAKLVRRTLHLAARAVSKHHYPRSSYSARRTCRLQHMRAFLKIRCTLHAVAACLPPPVPVYASAAVIKRHPPLTAQHTHPRRHSPAALARMAHQTNAPPAALTPPHSAHRLPVTSSKSLAHTRCPRQACGGRWHCNGGRSPKEAWAGAPVHSSTHIPHTYIVAFLAAQAETINRLFRKHSRGAMQPRWCPHL